MSKKNKKILKTNIISFIVGTIISGCIGVYAITYFPSNDVTYDNSISGLQSTNVQGAIDELYEVCTYEPTGGEQILDKEDVVTSGDGLYEDEYEEGRFIYRGANPNNYIKFNNELWRIISIENDGTIKILRNSLLSQRYSFDNDNYSLSSDWSKPVTLNTYLNGDYLNSLTDKDFIENHSFNIGAVNENNAYNNIELQISMEKEKKWSGEIGLISSSEYIRANSAISTCGTMSQHNRYPNYKTCVNTNWMFTGSSSWMWWTINAVENPTLGPSVWGVHYQGPLSSGGTTSNNVVNGDFDVRPALYLSSEIKITGGMGTQGDPYEISL